MKQITIQKKHNFRDLGGIPVKDGRTVMDGVFYRSGAPHLMEADAVEELRTLGIVSILDLRDIGSHHRKADPDIGAVQIDFDRKVPNGGEGIDFTPEGFALHGDPAQEQLSKLYQYYMGMPYHNQALHAMFETVRKGDVPLLIHCTKGKDRTGIAVMMLMLALGADRVAVLEEYLRSNEYRCEVIAERMAEADCDPQPDEGYRTLMFLREGVTETVGEMILDHLFQQNGSIEQYMQEEYGWSTEILKDVQNRYLR